MRILLLLVLWALSYTVFAQQTSPYEKFGKISVSDLQRKIYPIDSNARAVVLADFGTSAIEGNSKGWFSLTSKRHRIVHILNKNGYDEADVEIQLYDDGDREVKLENIKAVTYNLEGGKIVETKLDKGSIFTEKLSREYSLKKFTLPNVKEGSIIEYEYKIVSDFLHNLRPWYFQSDVPVPVLWSEYKLSLPQFFSYAFMGYGYHPYHIKGERKDHVDNFTVFVSEGTTSTKRIAFSAGVSDFRWVMKDVPPLKMENFTSTLKNHIARIEFQMASQSDPLEPRDFRNTWPALAKNLLEADYFGSALDKGNFWLADEVKPLIAGLRSETDKARKIYEYVRDNFMCTDYDALAIDQPLKTVHRAKKGNVSEINLLLTAMLRFADLKADPVILSTTDHGYALPSYPMITNFNYVITRLEAEGGTHFLDGSRPGLGFGKMLPELYNGHARLVSPEAPEVMLSADSLKEKQVSAVFLANDASGKWKGSMKQSKGYVASYIIRNKVKENGEESVFNEMQKKLGLDIRITESKIDSLERLDDPVSVNYLFEMDPFTEDILYINPMFGEGNKDNPFKSAQRFYPVEMPYTVDHTYILTMEVPKGYEVDELPKQLIAKLDQQESASFEYRISQSGNHISLRSRVKISRTFFMPEEYETLRSFFSLIVNKQNEQIVLKKKK